MKNFIHFFIIVFIFLVSHSIVYSETSEYGSQNFNYYLTGLGLNVSYVSIPHQPAFNRDISGTLEMWVYPTTISGSNRTLITKGNNSFVSFLFGISGSDSRLFLRIGATDFFNTDGIQIPLNQWTHVAVTWSGPGNYNVIFYINGTLSGTPVNTLASWSTNTDPVIIGNSPAYTTYSFIGNIDEVRFWSAIRTESQIRNNRFVGLGDGLNSNLNNALTAAIEYTGLISSWTFNSPGNPVQDNISGYNGTYVGSATNSGTVLGTPIPYNFALKLPGGNYDNVRLPNSTIFNQTNYGTWELWFKPVSFVTEQILISKGSTAANLSFVLGVTPTTGKLYFGIGLNISVNSSGIALTLNQWNHIAITWFKNGANFDITFYKNGIQNGTVSSILFSAPLDNDPVLIGNSMLYNLPAKGFIDELRYWDQRLTQEQISNNIFVSGRALTGGGLLGVWNFDGNLLNYSGITGIDATFNNSSPNYCRFSGYANDSTSGAYGSNFISYSTVINRADNPNSYPSLFRNKSPFVTIPDNNTNGISDSILITTPSGLVSSVELFMSIQHPYIGDITVSLRAPNGVTKNIINRHGGSGDNVLTFASDNFTYTSASTAYQAPWGYIKPFEAFGNFGNALSQGYWVLKCADLAANDVGILQGWGLKFVTISDNKNISSEVPKEFKLLQNYPNPFNPMTKIIYNIAKNSYVTLKIYDILGKEIVTLIDKYLTAGVYQVDFDGSKLSSGVYYYKITTGDFSNTKTMTIIK